MEIRTNIELESSGYRCLFDYIKKEGIEPTVEFFEHINQVPSDNKILIKQAILEGKNDLSIIVRNNKNITKFLKEHKKDMQKLDLTNPNIKKALARLKENNTLIDLYLENAKRLEDLKVEEIEIEDFQIRDVYNTMMYRTTDGRILILDNYFTDGVITDFKNQSRGHEYVEHSYYGRICALNNIYDNINNEQTTFCLKTKINELGYQDRTIKISDFGFNGEKLPTEEELRSCELPILLTKK